MGRGGGLTADEVIEFEASKQASRQAGSRVSMVGSLTKKRG
jgi:hypothetical protein